MYGTVAGWIAYALARGVTVVDGTASAHSLQRASDYIRTRYVVRYGLDTSSDAVIEAAYIAAGYESGEVGFWSTTYTPAQQKVLVEVKGIKWQPTGSSSGPDSALPVSPAIDALLTPASGSGAVFMAVG